ncbi:NADH-quinone oxidoreductase subunit NuoE [bacterium]|nr:NADH-quinone oxidoreductase subunit NuoE [candidate division CSSED10-310 bacterium]
MTEATLEEKQYIEKTDYVLEKNKFDSNALIAILQDVQHILGYIPKTTMKYIAERLDIPISRVYSVATFYKAFKLSPVGKHMIKVCLGTACHIKGGPLLMKALESELGVQPEEVTPDGKFSYEPVRCVGCCGLAPVIMIDENFHGKVKPADIKKIIKQYD